jgi:hypothetical protein
VDGFFEAHRERFGPKRTSGARRMRGDAAALTREGGLFSLRDLAGNGQSSRGRELESEPTGAAK